MKHSPTPYLTCDNCSRKIECHDNGHMKYPIATKGKIDGPEGWYTVEFHIGDKLWDFCSLKCGSKFLGRKHEHQKKVRG